MRVPEGEQERQHGGRSREYVIAVEASDVMAAPQRPPMIPPALRASAADLPLRDDSADAAMAMLTIHH